MGMLISRSSGDSHPSGSPDSIQFYTNLPRQAQGPGGPKKGKALLSMPLEHAPWETWAERQTQRWGAGHLLGGARGLLGESLGKRGLAPRKRPPFHQSPFRSAERDGRSPGGSQVPPCASANFPEINKPQASPSGAKRPGFAHSAGLQAPGSPSHCLPTSRRLARSPLVSKD